MYYKAWIWKEKYLYIVHAPHLNCIFKQEATWAMSLTWKILLWSPCRKEHGPSFEETYILFTKGCFVPSLVEIGPVVLEEKIFKICPWFLLFRNLPSEMGMALCLNNLNSRHPMMLCAKFGWNWPSRKFF